MPLINRRRFGTAFAGIAGSWTASYLSAAPALLTGSAPQVSDGVASGDVTRSEAVLWSRSDRAARMCVEWSDSAAFTQVRRRVGPVTGPSTDFTAKILLRGLPSGQRIHYRIGFEDSHGHMGYKVAGSLLTAPATPKPASVSLGRGTPAVKVGASMRTEGVFGLTMPFFAKNPISSFTVATPFMPTFRFRHASLYRTERFGRIESPKKNLNQRRV